MAPRLSTRISIRWADEPAFEDTNTVVLSIDSYYMDLRIKKTDLSIDWAFAGTREILSQDPHEGKFQKLPNGEDLERGTMSYPERGNSVTPYEEIWRELQPLHSTNRGWILQGRFSGNTVFLGQYGGVYLAMQQDKAGTFSVLKEEIINKQAHLEWKRVYRSGTAELPSLETLGYTSFPGEENWKVDDMVRIEKQEYQVRALHTLGE